MTSGKIGVVAIGRNEGERFTACLASLDGFAGPVVYVDSGSTDGSVEAARAAGVEVVELDMSRPFTAARARNAGVGRLRAAGLPDYVQFVDGDCVFAPGWLDAAATFLDTHPAAAVVAGRLRERFPERSVYNRLCDAEWDTPLGQVDACGGIAMMRASAFEQAGGFREGLMAGEEPELCLRLRQAGGEIWRIEADMALHDAAMTRFWQWWRRTRRAGHAFAEGYALHGKGPERHYQREVRRILLWAGALPLAILLLGLINGHWARYALAIYPLQVLRLSARLGMERAFFLTLGRFAEMQGLLDFWRRRLSGAGAKPYDK